MNVRPLTNADAEAVAAISAADEAALRGRPSHIESGDVLSWWQHAELERDSWLFEEDGSALAAGWFERYGELGQTVGVVAQEAKGRGLGTAMADRGEERARARGVERFRTFLLPEDAAARALFEARGFREVRCFYEMAIELAAPPTPPAVAGGLVLEAFTRLTLKPSTRRRPTRSRRIGASSACRSTSGGRCAACNTQTSAVLCGSSFATVTRSLR